MCNQFNQFVNLNWFPLLIKLTVLNKLPTNLLNKNKKNVEFIVAILIFWFPNVARDINVSIYKRRADMISVSFIQS